jgi:hypothetical protein
LISIVCIGPIIWQRKYFKSFSCKNLNAGIIEALGVLPVIFSPILNFGGKSIIFFLVLYLIGYYVIFEDQIMDQIVKYRFINLIIMMVADAMDVYLFIWTKNANTVLITAVMYITCWFGILTLLGFGSAYFNQSNRLTKYLTSRSFLFYIFHFVWLILFQFYLSKFTTNVVVLFIVPVIGTYLMTFLTAEIVIKVKACWKRVKALKINHKVENVEQQS